MLNASTGQGLSSALKRTKCDSYIVGHSVTAVRYNTISFAGDVSREVENDHNCDSHIDIIHQSLQVDESLTTKALCSTRTVLHTVLTFFPLKAIRKTRSNW